MFAIDYEHQHIVDLRGAPIYMTRYYDSHPKFKTWDEAHKEMLDFYISTMERAQKAFEIVSKLKPEDSK